MDVGKSDTARQGDQPSITAEPSSTALELYKLAVEMADKVSARRTSANNFFVALHATLATVIGLLGVNVIASPSGRSDVLPTFVVGTAGIMLCAAWWLGLRSYRDLNRAKFKVITNLEPALPIQIFTDEWRFLRGDEVVGWRGRYAEQGTVERIVPLTFGGLYLFAIGWSLLG